jgi:fucose 4-O-acetylase-like acetyltransferase
VTAETTHPDRAPEQPGAGGRVALWDNAKFLVIVLVVVGHLISTVRTETAFGFGLYAIIYLFHMPAMILLSGIFAKLETTPKAVVSTAQLLATWLVWEVIWAGIRQLGGERAVGDAFLVSPAWTLWFLVSLATMRILFPYIARLRHPLTCSVVIALLAGLSPEIGSEFSASRTLCLLPFFVLGWKLRSAGWSEQPWFARPSARVRAAAWAGLALIAAVFLLMPDLIDQWRIDTWLTWTDHYGALFADAPPFGFEPSHVVPLVAAGTAIRLALLAIAAGMTLALLLITPRGGSRITAWGAQTLSVYLLHGPIVWTLRHFGAVDAIGGLGVAGVAILVAIGIVLTIALAAGPIARAVNWVTTPRIGWLFTR